MIEITYLSFITFGLQLREVKIRMIVKFKRNVRAHGFIFANERKHILMSTMSHTQAKLQILWQPDKVDNKTAVIYSIMAVYLFSAKCPISTH